MLAGDRPPVNIVVQDNNYIFRLFRNCEIGRTRRLARTMGPKRDVCPRAGVRSGMAGSPDRCLTVPEVKPKTAAAFARHDI
ncbi:hypothetical protein DXH78_04270 [Undibacter mobilis]|uniref:Uncharacterized protein n=1 Tax=Undibacter mobilis TaxID=2292256 RepID=A0A371B8G2_9BRAD|nr:hypothetical protein DXH78_04270 [Undibacter mobilis]